MQAMQRIQKFLLLSGLIFTLRSAQLVAQADASATKSAAPAIQQRDGQHDFDFEIGTWKIHLKRLQHPLTGSSTWVEFDGTSVVRKLWGGRANLVELEADGPVGHFEGLNLRL